MGLVQARTETARAPFGDTHGAAERGESSERQPPTSRAEGLTGCQAIERLRTTMLLIFSTGLILRQPGPPP